VPSEAPSEGWGAGGDASLLNRFKVLIKDARFFDSLVGYFYTSVRKL